MKKRFVYGVLMIALALSACRNEETEATVSASDTETAASEEDVTDSEPVTEERSEPEESSVSEQEPPEEVIPTLPSAVTPDEAELYLPEERDCETEYVYYTGIIPMEMNGQTVFSEEVPELSEECFRYEKKIYAGIGGRRVRITREEWGRHANGELYLESSETRRFRPDGTQAVREVTYAPSRKADALYRTASVYEGNREVECGYFADDRLSYVIERHFKDHGDSGQEVLDDRYYDSVLWDCDYTRYEADGTVTEECVCVEKDAAGTVLQTITLYYPDGSFMVRYENALTPPPGQ